MNRYPAHSDLESWISPRYWDSYQAGVLHEEHLARDPFPHYVLDGFFRDDVFEQIRLECDREQTANLGTGEQFRQQGYVRNPDLLRLIYGQPLRTFLGALTGKALERPQGPDLAATAQAQVLRYFRKPGLRHVHTDEDAGIDLGMFIYLTPEWRTGMGGELGLYRRVGDLMLEEKAIPPSANTLVLLPFSTASWHGVRDMTAGWTRSVIFLGWQMTTPTTSFKENSLDRHPMLAEAS